MLSFEGVKEPMTVRQEGEAFGDPQLYQGLTYFNAFSENT